MAGIESDVRFDHEAAARRTARAARVADLRPGRAGRPPAVAGLRLLEQAARTPIDRMRGFHVCGFRAVPTLGSGPAPTGLANYTTAGGDTLHLGNASLEIHADGWRWVAPNLVLHYIVEHSYLPPTR